MIAIDFAFHIKCQPNTTQLNTTHLSLVRISLKMFKLKTFQKYFLIFSLFGFNSYIPFARDDEKWAAKFRITPVLNIIAIFTFLLLFYVHVFLQYTFSVKYLYMALATIPNLVAVLQGVFNRESCRVLLKTFSLILSNLELALNTKVSIQNFEKIFLKKYSVLTTVIIGPSILKMVFTTFTTFHVFSEIGVTTAFVYQSVQIIVIVFYVDFIQLIMDHINRKLIALVWDINPCSNYLRKQNIIHSLWHVKIVHFKLWHCVHRINKRFGWFLVTVMLGNLFIMTFSGFWTFMYATTLFGADRITTIRKLTF